MTQPLIDALGRPITLERPPGRIISLVPSLTELLAWLGLDQEVVGITRYCIHPEGWRQTRAIVGGTKKARIERVRPLAPDLILANKEENTREDVEQLQQLAPVYVTDVNNLEDCLQMILAVGQLVDRSDQAHDLHHQLQQRFAALAAHTHPARRALYLIWRKPWMAAGSQNFIDDMLRLAGYQNVLSDQPRYPQLTLEQLQALRPQEVLLSSEPYPFGPEHLAELSQLLPESRVRLVDGEAFSWYGSHLLTTPAYLQSLREGDPPEDIPPNPTKEHNRQ